MIIVITLLDILFQLVIHNSTLAHFSDNYVIMLMYKKNLTRTEATGLYIINKVLNCSTAVGHYGPLSKNNHTILIADMSN